MGRPTIGEQRPAGGRPGGLGGRRAPPSADHADREHDDDGQEQRQGDAPEDPPHPREAGGPGLLGVLGRLIGRVLGRVLGCGLGCGPGVLGRITGRTPDRIIGRVTGCTPGRIAPGRVTGCTPGRIAPGRITGCTPGRIAPGRITGCTPGRIAPGCITGRTPDSRRMRAPNAQRIGRRVGPVPALRGRVPGVQQVGRTEGGPRDDAEPDRERDDDERADAGAAERTHAQPPRRAARLTARPSVVSCRRPCPHHSRVLPGAGGRSAWRWSGHRRSPPRLPHPCCLYG